MAAENQRIYLDTNVILDIIEERREESKLLLNKIMESNWYCCTSMFALCEIIDIEQQFTYIKNMLSKKYTLDHIMRNRKQKKISQLERQDAIDKASAFFEDYPVATYAIEKQAWDKALEILNDYNISACDAVQFATAIEAKCTLFISSDRELGKQVNKRLKWLKPEDAIKLL